MTLHRHFDRCQGIARTGDLGGEGGVQHGQIIEVVASGKDVLRAQVEQTAELAQGGAFAEAGVGKTQVDGVALKADVRLGLLLSLNPSADAVHFLTAGGDDAEVAVVPRDELRLSAGIDKTAHGIEEGGVIFDKALMGAAGLFVPGAKVRPAAEQPGSVHIALAHNEVIGLHEQPVLGQALQRLPQAAAGIHHPGGTLSAQVLDHLAQPRVKHWIRLRQHQGAIEVEAEDERGFGLGHEVGKAPSMPKTAGSAKSSLI